MSSVSLRLSALAFIALASCGNPMTLQKDLNSEEEKRKNAEKTSTELTEQVRLLKSYLTNIYTSSNNLWVFSGYTQSYSVARAQCADIGYTLPSSYDMEEFKNELLPTQPAWSKVVNNLQIEGKPVQLDAPNAVLCRIARK